jgi:uncharacterized protein (TIGR02246 family)
MKRTFLSLTAAAFLFTALPALAGDVEDLQATFEQAVKALNSRNLEGFLATVHPQGLSFYSCGPTSGKQGREACEQDWQQFFSKTGSANFKTDDFKFRVIGNTGLVWGKYTVSVQPKSGPPKSYAGRFSLVYTKTEGKWMIVWQENAPMQPES